MDNVANKILLLVGLILFTIALFLIGVLIIECCRKKKKSLEKSSNKNLDLEQNGLETSLHCRYAFQNNNSSSNRTVQQPSTELSVTDLSYQRPRHSLEIQGQTRIFSLRSPSPSTHSQVQWSSESEISTFSSSLHPQLVYNVKGKEFISKLEDLPPSYLECFRFPVVQSLG